MKIKHPALIKIGCKIRKLRKDKGYSQEAFVDAVGVDRTCMGGVERGERNIAVINIIRIANVLKVEVGDLFPSIRTLTLE